MTDELAASWERALTVFLNHGQVAAAANALTEDFFARFPERRDRLAEAFIFSLSVDRLLSAGAEINPRGAKHPDSPR